MLNATLEKLKAKLFAKHAKEALSPELDNIQKLIMTLGDSLGSLSEKQKEKLEKLLFKIQKLSTQNQESLIMKLEAFEAELARLNDVESKVDKINQKVETINNNDIITVVNELKATIKKKDFRGKDGKTPVKGVDYLDDTEIDAIVKEIVALIPAPKDGVNGKDGEDGKDGSPDTPEQIKEKLKELKVKDKWFDAGHIKNLLQYNQTIYETAGISEHNNLNNLEWSKAGHTIDTDVDVASNDLENVNAIKFDLVPDVPEHIEGLLHYDETSKTLALDLAGGSVSGQILQEELLRAKNVDGNVTESDPKAMYISGASGSNPEMNLADPSSFETAKVAGINTEDINSNSIGYYTTYGRVNSVNTSAFNDGDLLWVDNGGVITNTRPTKPKYGIVLGYCLRAHASQGVILVEQDVIYKLSDLSDVSISSPTNGQTVIYNSGTGLWENQDFPDLLIAEYLGNFADTTTALADSGVQVSQRGDWFTIDTDGGQSYIVIADSPTTNSDIAKLKAPTDAVQSVNGQTGVVSLDTDDIEEGAMSLYYTEGRVSANDDVSANTNARHDAVTLGTNTANALSLSGQQLSIGDVFLRNSGGDTMNGDLTITGTTTVQNNLYNTSGGVYGSGNFDDKKMASVGYVKSKGMNLVVNGSGFLQNNYNFSSTTFDQTELYAGFGSFKSTARSGVFTDEYISVDPNLYYVGSAWFKTTNLDTSNKAYGGIECSDVDGNLIAPYYTMRYAGSTPTTLASDLNNGDTTMELTDATGWYTGGTAYNRQALFFGYQNSFGYTYPDYTYSRNSTYNTAYTNPVNYRTAGFWSTTGISGNTITLTSPWPGDTIPAGTAVQNGSSGGTFKYSFGLNITILEDWTQLTGVIGTVDDTGLNQDYRFHPGTAFIRLVFLTNYPTEDNNEMNISSIYFSEITPENSIREIEYTASGTLAINEPYTHFRFSSASPISMGLNIPQTPKKEIFMRNVGTANVTLTGTSAKASTVPTTLAPGEKISAIWNYENQQWE